ncbi:MAG TPA: recombinase family protein [Solirubrobacteraceae bacterium]|nr:recombinase family protein [Solirubrobacteraceae bacterium]
MDQYVRVSRVAGRSGESFISPDLQREQGADWAASRGVEIAMIHEDLDQSGGKVHRPGLDALLARIKSGETDGVIVAKLDRLSRLGVADALRLVEQITEAGGSIAALDLGIDPTTTFGRFALTMMLAMAAMEHERHIEAWEIAKTRALDRGARMGPTPFGFKRAPDATIEPHPTHAPILAEAFGRAALHGVDAALTYLREQVPDERTWNAFTVRRLLRNRTYLGETRYGDRLVRDSHPPLVDRATFERAHPGEERPKRRAAAVFPLSGLATCAACGEILVGGRGGLDKDGNAKRTYRCRASLNSWKGERCSAPANVAADRLESYLVERIMQAYEQSGTSDVAANVTDTDGTFEDTQRELEAAESEVERFASDPTAAELLGEVAWSAALRTRTERAAAARVAYREHVDTMRADDVEIPPVELLDTLTPEELTTVLRSVFQTVRVTRGRGPLPDRVELAFHGEPHARVATLQNAA